MQPKEPRSGGGEYDQKISIIEEKIRQTLKEQAFLKQSLENKADLGQVARLEQIKIDKEDVLTLIPTTEPRDLIREEIKEEAAYLSKNMNELGRAWDLKLVKLRNDLDLHSIRKEISTKANDDEVRREIQSQEYKVGNLERSVFKLAFDCETF